MFPFKKADEKMIINRERDETDLKSEKDALYV